MSGRATRALALCSLLAAAAVLAQAAGLVHHPSLGRLESIVFATVLGFAAGIQGTSAQAWTLALGLGVALAVGLGAVLFPAGHIAGRVCARLLPALALAQCAVLAALVGVGLLLDPWPFSLAALGMAVFLAGPRRPGSLPNGVVIGLLLATVTTMAIGPWLLDTSLGNEPFRLPGLSSHCPASPAKAWGTGLAGLALGGFLLSSAGAVSRRQLRALLGLAAVLALPAVVGGSVAAGLGTFGLAVGAFGLAARGRLAGLPGATELPATVAAWPLHLVLPALAAAFAIATRLVIAPMNCPDPGVDGIVRVAGQCRVSGLAPGGGESLAIALPIGNSLFLESTVATARVAEDRSLWLSTAEADTAILSSLGADGELALIRTEPIDSAPTSQIIHIVPGEAIDKAPASVPCRVRGADWDPQRSELLMNCSNEHGLFAFVPATGGVEPRWKLPYDHPLSVLGQNWDQSPGLWIDEAGKRAYLLHEDRGTFLVEVSLPDGKRLRTLPVGGWVGSVVIDSSSDRLYLSRPTGSSVLVVDLQHLVVREQLRLGFGVGPLALLHGSGLLAVANPLRSELTLVDLQTLEVTDRVRVGFGANVLATDAAGEKLYITTSCGTLEIEPG
jgi:hypothetical protein